MAMSTSIKDHPVTSMANALPSIPKKVKLDGLPLDGQWGVWSVYSQCSSECIISSGSQATPTSAIGVQLSTRKCDNPIPSNGGKSCDGSDKRVKLCDAS